MLFSSFYGPHESRWSAVWCAVFDCLLQTFFFASLLCSSYEAISNSLHEAIEHCQSAQECVSLKLCLISEHQKSVEIMRKKVISDFPKISFKLFTPVIALLKLWFVVILSAAYKNYIKGIMWNQKVRIF